MLELPYHHDRKPLLDLRLDIRVHWFGRYGGDPKWSIEPSRLASDMVAFFYLEKGRCRAQVNGASYAMEPRQLLVLRGGDLFSFVQDPRKIQTSLSASLSIAHDSTDSLLLQSEYPRCRALAESKLFVERFEAVLSHLQRDTPWRTVSLTAALLGWLDVIHNELRPKLDSSFTPGVSRQIVHAQKWARDRLAHNLTVAEWAKACGLNTDYFSRLFLRHTGMRPAAWLLETRMQYASQLLGLPGVPVAGVAERCGFKCPFHFSRTFKKRFGVAPSFFHTIQTPDGFGKPGRVARHR